MWNHLETNTLISEIVPQNPDFDSPEGSTGSGGRGEAGGMLVYAASFFGVKPGEFWMVTFRL